MTADARLCRRSFRAIRLCLSVVVGSRVTHQLGFDTLQLRPVHSAIHRKHPFADAAAQVSLRDSFARMASALTGSLGEPSSRQPGEDPEIRWAGEKTTLQLVCLRTTVRLYLVTNSWLAMHDKTIELQEQGLI
ncbi:DUF6301 family protein [Nocardia beijingensis]